MNAFSKILSILLCVIVLFGAPLLQLAQKQDDISQIYVSNTTTQFIDSIKNSGYISRQMYQSFVQNIDKTGNLYNISICHSHKVVEPNVDETTDSILEGYNTYFINTYEDEILESFDRGEDYKFNQGDYISISVSNRTKTLAGRLLGQIIPSTGIEQIICIYGGMIRDEVE